MVSFTDGKGKLGSDVWKLFSIGLCMPEKIFTSTCKVKEQMAEFKTTKNGSA